MPAERALPNDRLFYRQGLQQLLSRLRAGRMATLRSEGWDAAARARAVNDSLLRPYARARFAPFSALQPWGPGKWTNGTLAEQPPRVRANGDARVLATDKCAVGLWATEEAGWEAATAR